MNKLFVFFVVFKVMNFYSQDVKKHQWENRVLLIFSDDKFDERLYKQLKILSKEKKGLKERKLKIYQFAKNTFKNDFDSIWLPSKLKTQQYKRKSEKFKILLIGLDGGVKLKQTKILSKEKLFAIIDGMPMRRSEIRNKN